MVYTKIDECKEWLKTILSKERYEHSLGTAECAYYLAEKFDEDKDKAYFCGLVHDCAKCLSIDEQNNIAQSMLTELCEGEFENSKALHAPCGCALVKEKYKVDTEFLDAIRWHTLGSVNMTNFQKIIFLADKMESRTRPQTLVEELKKELDKENGLDKALFVCYKNTIKSLVDRELKICKQTVDVYNNLLNNLYQEKEK